MTSGLADVLMAIAQCLVHWDIYNLSSFISQPHLQQQLQQFLSFCAWKQKADMAKFFGAVSYPCWQFSISDTTDCRNEGDIDRKPTIYVNPQLFINVRTRVSGSQEGNRGSTKEMLQKAHIAGDKEMEEGDGGQGAIVKKDRPQSLDY